MNKKEFLAKLLDDMPDDIRATMEEMMGRGRMGVVAIDSKSTIASILKEAPDLPPMKLFDILTELCKDSLENQEKCPYKIVRKDGAELKDGEADAFSILPTIGAEGAIEGAQYGDALGKVMDLTVSLNIISRIVEREIETMKVIQGEISPELMEEHLVRMNKISIDAVNEGASLKLLESISSMTGLNMPSSEKVWGELVEAWDKRHGVSFDGEERKNGTH